MSTQAFLHDNDINERKNSAWKGRAADRSRGSGDLRRVRATLSGCKRDWGWTCRARMGDQNVANRQFGAALVSIRPDHRLITTLDCRFRFTFRRASHQCGKASGVVVCFHLLPRARDAHEAIGVDFGRVVDCFGVGGRALQHF